VRRARRVGTRSARAAALLALLLASCGLAARSADATTFTASSSTTAVAGSPFAVAVGNLTGGTLAADAFPDLAITGTASSNATVSLLGNDTGDATLTLRRQFFNVGESPYGVAIGDINGDGFADVVVAPQNADAGVTLLRKSGTGTSYTNQFVAAPDANAHPTAIGVGDFDGDGKLDIATVNTNSTLVLYLRTSADGTAAPTFSTVTLDTGPNPSDLAVGDLNGDGRSDLAVANVGNNGGSDCAPACKVTVWLKDAADSGFTRQDVPLAGAADEQSSVAIGDLNGDGRPDIAVTILLSNKVKLLLQNADGSYTLAPTLTAGTAADVQDVVIGDLDGDGMPDLAVSNHNDQALIVLLHNPDGSYTPTPVTVGFPGKLAIADLAGAGKLDIVAPNPDTNTVTIVANTTPQATGSTLGASPTSPSTFGDAVTFTATPSAVVTGKRGQAALTGTATYTVDGRDTAPVALAGGASPLSSAALAVGSHTIAATYSGDANFASSTKSTTYDVAATTTLTGTQAGPLTVTGPTRIHDAHITGALTVSPGATLDLEDSTVDGNLTASGGAALRVCDSRIGGSASVTASTAVVVFGDANGVANCAANTVVGPLSLTSNANGVRAIANSVGGSVTDSSNSGPGPFPGDPTLISGNIPIAVVSLSAPPTFADTVVDTTSVAQTVTVTNAGVADLHVTNVVLMGAEASQFAIPPNVCSAAIAPGGHCSVDVTFHPTSLGVHAATLRITSDASPGQDDVALSATAVTPAHLSLSSPGGAFPDTIVDTTSAARTFTVTNDGGAPLAISATTLLGLGAGQFAVIANTCAGATIAPAGHCAVDVAFKPLLVGSYVATLRTSSDAPSGQDDVALSGTAVAAPQVALSATSSAFAETVVGATAASRAFTVTDGGGAPLHLSAVALVGTGAAQFALTADGCSGASLAPAGQYSVAVAFAPTAAGSHAATVVLTSDAISSPDTIALTGTGVAPAQTPPPPGPNPPPPPPPPAPIAPSNLAHITNATGAARGAITVSVTFPGAGRYVLAATSSVRAATSSKTTKLTYAVSKSGKTTRATRATIHVKPGARAALALRRAKRLRVVIAVTFTPTGGTRRTVTKTVTATYSR
jgi:hypothetical protein